MGRCERWAASEQWKRDPRHTSEWPGWTRAAGRLEKKASRNVGSRACLCASRQRNFFDDGRRLGRPRPSSSKQQSFARLTRPIPAPAVSHPRSTRLVLLYSLTVTLSVGVTQQADNIMMSNAGREEGCNETRRPAPWYRGAEPPTGRTTPPPPPRQSCHCLQAAAIRACPPRHRSSR